MREKGTVGKVNEPELPTDAPEEKPVSDDTEERQARKEREQLLFEDQHGEE